MSTETDLVKERDLEKEQYLIELKKALKKKGIAANVELDDQFLLKFLRAKVFNVNDVCNLIKCYVSNFKKYPEFFEGVDYCRPAIESGVFHLFPDQNVTGERIGNLCPGNWEPSEVSFEAIVASTVCGFEIAELDEQTQLSGAIEIVDCANVGLKQFTKIGISHIRLMSNMSENALPIRWRKIFVCNENNFIDILFKMAKPFLSKEFKERIEFIGQDFTRLYKEIPREYLPPKYGGTSDRCDPKLFFNELKATEPELIKLWSPFKGV